MDIDIIGMGTVAVMGLVILIGFSAGILAIYVAMKEVHEEY